MTTLEREFFLRPFAELRLVTSVSAAEASWVVLQRRSSVPGASEEERRGPRADIFGTELLPGVPLRLPSARSISIFSNTGCTLMLSAPPSVLQKCYATTCCSTAMHSLLDLHGHLEAGRVEARTPGGLGPRVLFVSDRRQCGTSTYVQWLAQYAVRLGYHPLVLDAEPAHPHFGLPACVSLYQLQYTIDLEEGMNFVPGQHALCGTSRSQAPALFTHALVQLAQLSTEKMGRDERSRVGGLFIDYGAVSGFEVAEAERQELEGTVGGSAAPGSPGVTATTSSLCNPLDTLLDVIVQASVDHVFVVQSAWLRFKIAQRAAERFGGPSSGGTAGDAQVGAPAVLYGTDAPAEVRCLEEGIRFKLSLIDGAEYVPTLPTPVLRQQKWHRYFFGSETSPVTPALLSLSTASLRLARLGGAQQSSMSTLMPMMDEESTFGAPARDPASVTFFTTTDVELQGRIVAISAATECEARADGAPQRLPFPIFERRLRQCMIAGFALVKSVTAERITLLVNAAPLFTELGLCLLLTDEFLGPRT